MVITYYGDGGFRFQSGETSFLVDPTNTRLKADVTLRTLTPTTVTGSAENEIVFPGEYEVRGLEISGWMVEAESTVKFVKTIYLVRLEDLAIALLGHLATPLSAELLEHIGEPDVLVLPANGEHFLSAEAVAKLVKQVNPRIVLPSFTKNPGELAKAFGQKAESEEKLVFRKKDLSIGQSRVVILRSA